MSGAVAEIVGDAAAVEREPSPDSPHAKTFRLLTLEHLDGRTLAAKRVKELETAIVSDTGGEEHISSARRALVRRAAVLCAVLEDHEARWAAGDSAFDAELYLPGVNALGRVLERIGLDRRAIPVRNLRAHLDAAATAR